MLGSRARKVFLRAQMTNDRELQMTSVFIRDFLASRETWICAGSYSTKFAIVQGRQLSTQQLSARLSYEFWCLTAEKRTRDDGGLRSQDLTTPVCSSASGWPCECGECWGWVDTAWWRALLSVAGTAMHGSWHAEQRSCTFIKMAVLQAASKQAKQPRGFRGIARLAVTGACFVTGAWHAAAAPLGSGRRPEGGRGQR
jgi:hypothetical protein